MTIEGTNESDSIIGTENADVINGFDGADTLFGLAGDDTIFGGAGDDFLLGGAGNDVLDLGTPGAMTRTFDQARGGTGNDLLIGGTSSSTLLTGGAGNDTLDGSLGTGDEADYFDVGFGTDGGPVQAPGDVTGVFVDLSAGFAFDDGEGATDVLIGIENVGGSVFDDVIIGDVGDNSLNGQDGNDFIDGGEGNDFLDGAGGHDTLVGGGGSDFSFGGAGADTFVITNFDNDFVNIGDFSVADGDILDLSQTTLGLTDLDVLLLRVIDFGSGIDIPFGDGNLGIQGLSLADLAIADANGQILYGQPSPGLLLVGTPGNDEQFGGTGNDTIQGLDGDDSLFGEAGDDTLDGGAGFDFIAAGSGDDLLIGGTGGNALRGGPGFDTLDGTAGDADSADYFVVGLGFDGTPPREPGDNAGVVVDLSQGLTTDDGEGGVDVLIGIENALGSSFNDVLIGDQNDNNLFGEAGDDTIDGGGGFDFIAAGIGDDLLIGGTGGNALRGGPGFDTLDGTAGDADSADYFAVGLGFDGTPPREPGDNAGVVVDLSQGLTTDDGEGGVDVLIGIENALGSSFNDVLIGDENDNELFGEAGDDSISGGGGNDFLLGGAGNDTLDLGVSESGGFTLDQARGGVGDDLLIGGQGGPSLLTGGVGNDTLDGSLGTGDEADYFDVGFGLDGGPVQEEGDTVGINVDLSAGFAFDDGEGGTDVLIGIENVGGSFFDDVIIGDAGDNSLNGQGGNDFIDGGEGSNQLNGGDGNDTLVGSGTDTISGGAGADTFITPNGETDRTIIFDLSAADGDVLDLSTNLFSASDLSSLLQFVSEVPIGVRLDFGNQLIGLVGLTIDDLVTLDANGQIIYGDPVPGESIRGGNGDDDLAGGAGNDTLAGGNGADTISGGFGSDSLNGGNANDVLDGGTGDDTLLGGNGSDFLDSGAGDDILLGGNGNDTLAAGDGADDLKGNNGSDVLDSGAGDDTLVGGNGNDTLTAGDGADDLKGNNGSDLLLGGAGDDTLSAANGNDTLVGGAGDDMLTGGNGADLFVFAIGSGNDVITDYNPRNDLLDLSDVSAGFADANAVQNAVSEEVVDGISGVLIDLGGDDSLFLQGTSLADLGRADFIL